VLDSNWNLVGGAVSHGDFNNAGMTAGGVNGSMYYSYNGPGLSPEVLTSNPTGYNAVTMGGFWANGTYPGHDRPASNQGANYAVAGLLRIDPNAAGAAVTVLGNGRAYDPANRYWGNTEEGAAFIPDVSGAFTGHANSFIGTQGSISNGCAFNTIWENDAPPDANLTDHADISNPVFTRGYNYGNTESDRDFELVGGKLWESQGTSFARRITWIDSSFAVHVFYQNNTGLFDGGNGMSNGGMAAGRVTIGGADCDAVWVYTNDGTRTRISRLADANNDGVADNVAVIYDASSSTVPGDDPSSTWGDMELLTSLAGTKFLLAVDAANNRLIVLQLKPDGTYAGGYATVLTLPAGTLSGTGFSLNNIEFDASYRTALLPGDANLDGIVDQADYTRWYNGYGSNGGWSNGDFNGDGLVDQADYTLWYNNYGATGAAAPAEQTSSDASASATAPTVAPTVEAVVSGAGVPSPLPVQASVAAAPSIRPISTVETPAGASASSAAASRRGLSWRMPMVPSADAVLDVLEMLSRRF